MPTTSAAAASAASQKLGMATTSLYGNSSIPVRTPTRTFTTAASTALPPHAFSSSLPSFSIAPNRNLAWRRLAPGARLASLSIYHNCNYSNRHNKMTVTNNYLNVNIANIKKSTFLGFTFCAFPSFSPFSSLSPRIRSSSTRSGSDPSPPSGSGVAAGMGSENKLEGVDWNSNDHPKNAQAQPPSPSTSSNHHHYNKLLTLPTVLTLGRVVAVPLLVATFYMDSWWGRTATTSIFIAAAITDWLDGYLARKMRLGSAFGAFLDPVADKLMVAATLILLCSKPLEVGMFGQAPWLMTVPTIAIIGREITMSAVREWAASKSSKLLEAVAVSNLGKWKTATQMIALTILLATRDSSLGGPGILSGSGVVFLYISAGLSVWSLAVYMSKIWKVLLK